MKLELKGRFASFGLAITLICWAFSAQAKIEANLCITHIHEVLDATKDLHGETLGAFDWDEAISKVEGGYDVREAGPQGTLATVKALQAKGVKTMVLTSRMKGLGLNGGVYDGDYYSGKQVEDTVKNNDVPKMLHTLGSDWQQHGPLKTNDLEEIAIDGKLSYSGKRKLYALSKDQIVFAGGNRIKGETMVRLIDDDKLVKKPTNIIFVDNDEDYTTNFADVFRDRPESVYIFRYPGVDDKPCPKK